MNIINVKKISTINLIGSIILVAILSLVAIGCTNQVQAKDTIAVKDFYDEYEFVLPFEHERVESANGISEKSYKSNLSLLQQAGILEEKGYKVSLFHDVIESTKIFIEIVDNNISRYFSIYAKYTAGTSHPTFKLDNLGIEFIKIDGENSEKLSSITTNCLFPQQLILGDFNPSVGLYQTVGDFFAFKRFYENTKKEGYRYDSSTDAISFDTTAVFIQDISNPNGETKSVRVDIKIQQETIKTYTVEVSFTIL
ncbi:MAG: hypothetical protein FWF56_05370 [Firmicutes bacterium]|nr:hypothetical protein [Bacillota bacterium]MCL1953997.1 hypothetical protein [Bacillota bacterium]